MPQGSVNCAEWPAERSNGYHTEWDEISTETGLPGLEGAEHFTLEGTAGWSLIPCGQVEMVRNKPPWACDMIPASLINVGSS